MDRGFYCTFYRWRENCNVYGINQLLRILHLYGVFIVLPVAIKDLSRENEYAGTQRYKTTIAL